LTGETSPQKKKGGLRQNLLHTATLDVRGIGEEDAGHTGGLSATREMVVIVKEERGRRREDKKPVSVEK